MRQMRLSDGTFVLVDEDDYEPLARWSWQDNGSGYASRRVKLPSGKRLTIYMHREIAQTPRGMQADHMNRNPRDNRRANLRNVTRSTNTFNRPLMPNSTTGYRGVYLEKRGHRRPYRAHISHQRRQIVLGHFATAEEAFAARLAYEAEHDIFNYTPKPAVSALTALL